MDNATIRAFIESYRRSGIEAKALPTPLIEAFIRAHRAFLKQVYDETLSTDYAALASEPWHPLNIGGDTLHLSDSYREVHVRNWLMWLLHPPGWTDSEREQLLRAILPGLLDLQGDEANPNTWGPLLDADKEVPVTTELRLKDDQAEDRQLDLVFRFKQRSFVMEIKLEDRNVAKNFLYAEHLRKNPDFLGQPITLRMIAPASL